MNFTILTQCVFTRIAVQNIIDHVAESLNVNCTIHEYKQLLQSDFYSTARQRIHVLCDSQFDYLNVQKNEHITTINIIPKNIHRLKALVEKTYKSDTAHAPVDIYTLLTQDEQIVVDSLLAGYTQKFVASCNGTSIKRVSARKRRAMMKLGARTDQELFYLYTAHKNLNPVYRGIDD